MLMHSSLFVKIRTLLSIEFYIIEIFVEASLLSTYPMRIVTMIVLLEAHLESLSTIQTQSHQRHALNAKVFVKALPSNRQCRVCGGTLVASFSS